MILFIAALLFLVVIGAPLFVIVGTATTLCFFIFTGDHRSLEGLVPVTQNMEGLLKKQEFLAIPLFMASGAIMTAGGIAERLVRVFRAALGWMPGGMAIAAIAACMFFAAISGSSPVTLIAVGTIMFPALKRAGYPENFSLGLLTTAGSLGCLLPPSISILIYAISISATTAKVDPQEMFLAGIPAGLFVGLLLAIYAFRVGLKNKGAREKFDAGELGRAIKDGFWALLLPFVVLGGIYGGFYTPSEAGGVATVYALVVTTVIYKELPWKKLATSLADSAALMGSLILIIVLAFGLNQFLAEIEIQDRLMDMIREAKLGPVGFMLLVNALLVVIGALMDSISCTLIFAPMLAPVAHELYGIDPIHFGVVFVVNMEIGYLMPPVATNLFVAAATFRKPFGQVVKAVMPTLLITCAALVVLMYVPTISKFIVNWKQGKALAESFPWDGKPAEAPEPGTGKPVPGGTDIGTLTAEAMAETSQDAGPVGDGGVEDPDEDPYGLGGGGEKTPDAGHHPGPDAASTFDF